MGAAVIPGGDAAPVFEAADGVLDTMMLPVERLVVRDREFPVYSGRSSSRIRAVERHQGIARQVALEITAVPPLADATAKSDAGQPLAPAVPAPETAVETKREADFIEATRLCKTGTSISRMSRLLGVDRKTLRKDIGAVQAALDLPWTTSPVEGQISRLKMLKRTMYGRAGLFSCVLVCSTANDKASP